jgi:hypothetical protein
MSVFFATVAALLRAPAVRLLRMLAWLFVRFR